MKAGSGGGAKWVVDSTGRITNFDMKTLRGDILGRLQTGATLYTLEECRLFIVEMARLATEWQEEDFTNLIYLTEMHQRVQPGRRANYQWPLAVTPNIPFSAPCEGASDTILYRINKVVEELNRSIVRMVDKLWNDRRERLLLCARVLRDIEAVVGQDVASGKAK